MEKHWIRSSGIGRDRLYCYYCGNCGFLFACSLDVGSFVCGGACEAMDGWWRGGGWTGTGKDMVGLVDERYWARR